MVSAGKGEVAVLEPLPLLLLLPPDPHRLGQSGIVESLDRSVYNQ